MEVWGFYTGEERRGEEYSQVRFLIEVNVIM